MNPDIEQAVTVLKSGGLVAFPTETVYGLGADASNPEAVKKLYAATEQALSLPEVAKTLAREGTETSGSSSPEDFSAFLREDAKLWERLVKASGAKAD